MSLSRTDRSEFSDWWWTVDRYVFLAVIALMAIGLMLSFAASPAVSGGPSTEGNFNFAIKQVVFAGVAVAILIGSSLLSPVRVRRLAFAVFVLALIGSAVVLFVGNETYGAKRWLDLGWFTLQPSEFIKPGFAVLAAAVLAEKEPLPLPKPVVTFVLLIPALAILLAQPDVGQTFLLVALWAALLYFSGLALKWIWAIGGGTLGLGTLAYVLFKHVRDRVDHFLNPAATVYQTEKALKAFAHGGWFGAGPGAGTVKYTVPEVHSDFVLAVAGEEFGLMLCAVIAFLFCFLAVRLLMRSASVKDRFAQLASAGLAVVVALQAFVNMGVAVNLLPPKGMTLPFISYGGSSLFAVALTMGFALALIRHRPELELRGGHMLPFLGARP